MKTYYNDIALCRTIQNMWEWCFVADGSLEYLEILNSYLIALHSFCWQAGDRNLADDANFLREFVLTAIQEKS